MEINGIHIEITRKAMKSIRLAIKPPDARICVSAPPWITQAQIQHFILDRWDWILKNRTQVEMRARQSLSAHHYISGERHFLFGEEYELCVQESAAGPAVQLKYDKILLLVRPGSSPERREALLRQWYKVRLEKELYTLMNKWMLRLNEPDITWNIRLMKTRWGSCCPARRTMLFNLELARKPLPCIEYVVVHEFMHLQERYHNARFKQLMTQHLPLWPHLKKQLNAIETSPTTFP